MGRHDSSEMVAVVRRSRLIGGGFGQWRSEPALSGVLTRLRQMRSEPALSGAALIPGAHAAAGKKMAFRTGWLLWR
jgi:hypothetical protein